MDTRNGAAMKVLLLIFGVSFTLNGVAMLFFPEAWFFRLIPGVPDTGPFNSHLVRDIGTFYVPVGLGVMLSARDPARNALVVAVAAAASLFHALLHVYSHMVGWLHGNLATEIGLIYVPSAVLVVMAAMLMRSPQRSQVQRAAQAMSRSA